MTDKIELTHTLLAATLREEADVRASLGSVSRAVELRAMADALQSRGDALEAADAESPSPVPEQQASEVRKAVREALTKLATDVTKHIGGLAHYGEITTWRDREYPAPSTTEQKENAK